MFEDYKKTTVGGGGPDLRLEYVGELDLKSLRTTALGDLTLMKMIF